MLPQPTPWALAAIRCAAFALAYFLAAELGHALSLQEPDVGFATFWPASGLALAVLIHSPWRTWPSLLGAAAVANLSSDMLLHDKALPVAVGFFLANAFGACLGAALVRRFVGPQLPLTRRREVGALFLFGAVFGALAGAVFGAAVAATAFSTAYGTTLLMWWSADATGVLVFGPLVSTWLALDGRLTYLRALKPARLAEGASLFASLTLMAIAVYGEWLPPAYTAPAFVLPFLLWAATRFSPRTAAAAIFLVAVLGVWHTSRGLGPYRFPAQPHAHLLRISGILGVISLCSMVLAAVVAERRRVEAERLALIAKLQQALDEIKTLRGLIPICAWCSKIRDDSGYWQSVERYLSVHAQVEFTHGICPDCLARQEQMLRDPSKAPDQS